MILFWEKNNKGKAKQCYNYIFRWRRKCFSSEIEIRREIVWIKIFKKIKENSKEHSSTISTEASFNENIDKETHNVNKVCQQ